MNKYASAFSTHESFVATLEKATFCSRRVVAAIVYVTFDVLCQNPPLSFPNRGAFPLRNNNDPTASFPTKNCRETLRYARPKFRKTGQKRRSHVNLHKRVKITSSSFSRNYCVTVDFLKSCGGFKIRCRN